MKSYDLISLKMFQTFYMKVSDKIKLGEYFIGENQKFDADKNLSIIIEC